MTTTLQDPGIEKEHQIKTEEIFIKVWALVNNNDQNWFINCNKCIILMLGVKNRGKWKLPGGPVVWNLCFHSEGMGSILGQRTRIPHAVHIAKKRGNWV